VIHLTRVARRTARGEPTTRGFPFDVPAIATLPDLVLDRPVTILVGENGSGKSTLLEAVAIAARATTAGAADAADDETLAGVRALADDLRLSWATRRHRGFSTLKPCGMLRRRCGPNRPYGTRRRAAGGTGFSPRS